MESLRDVLGRRENWKKPSDGSTRDPEKRRSPQELGPILAEEDCPLCRGVGFVYSDAPLGHPDFGAAVPCRCTEQEMEETRTARLLRYSNLGPLVRLNFGTLDHEGRSDDPINKDRFSQTLKVALDFAEEPQNWLILMGPSGCGKTHLAAAIANRCIERGQPALFVVVPDLLDHLRASFSPGSDQSYDELFQQIRDAPVLILDDLGAHSSTPWAEEKLFQIINHRFNAELPTVVTTNLTLEDVPERLRSRFTDDQRATVCQVAITSESSLQYTWERRLALLKEMTFEAFRTDWDFLDYTQRESLKRAKDAAASFSQQPAGWLLLLGSYGCGKTHLAAAIANQCSGEGNWAVFFVVVPDLLDHLRATYAPESKVAFDTRFELLKQAPLLILDDLGANTSTPWAKEKLYQLINYRYMARLPTVITSSLMEEDLAKWTDLSVKSRLFDPRLSKVVLITAPDFRSPDRATQPRRGQARRRT